MAALVVGSTTISVAPEGVDRDLADSADRGRALDGSLIVSQLAAAKREWHFTTPPVPRATANTYETALALNTVQSCSGDVLGGSVNCFTERTGWRPTSVSGAHYVVLSFVLREA